jgi:hypothetical protein
MTKTRDIATIVSNIPGLRVLCSDVDTSIFSTPTFKSLTSKYVFGLDASLNLFNDINIRQDASINALFLNSPTGPSLSESLAIAYSIALS